MTAASEDGTSLRVRVQPKSASNRVVVDDAGRVRVSVTAPPSEGAANKAVCQVLAKRLGLAKSNVNIRSGMRSRDKVVRVDGIGEGEILRRLTAR
jgi:uncharacterized protein (TIGR00251 family)